MNLHIEYDTGKWKFRSFATCHDGKIPIETVEGLIEGFVSQMEKQNVLSPKNKLTFSRVEK